jgi:hypothetical protein
MLETGIDTDIQTNRPLAMKTKKKKDRATQGYRDAVSGALDLAAELQKGNPVVAILAKQYQARLLVLSSQDAECQAIERMIQSLRVPLEILPRMAEDRMRHVVGPHLEPFMNTAT